LCLLLTGATVLATGLAVGTASGGSRIAPGAVLDQSNQSRAATCRFWGWAPDDASAWAAQTFTAGKSGTLTDVVLPLRGPTDQITVAIAAVDANGMPIVSSPLASTTVAFVKPTTYTSVDFLLPSPPNVTAGKQYAIVLSSPTESSSAYVAWKGDIGSSYGDESGARCGDGAYPGGRAWTKGSAPLGTDADFFFETYIVPAAATQPPAPGKPASGTISAVNIRSLPPTPAAGAAFRVLPSIILSTGRQVTPTSFRCTARLAGSPLKGSGRGGCTFQIPKTAGGKRLTLAVTAGYGGKTKLKAVVYTVRRRSAPPTAPPAPPSPPSPIAQAGHYAGTTLRGTPVSFDVTSDGRAITNITFGLSIPCSPSGTLSNPGISVLPTARFTIAADGTFAPFTNVTTTLTGSVTARLTFTFGGRFTGPGAATGTLALRASVTAPGAYECGPISDSWTATHT
jgi:hypothetical protein